MTAAEIIPLIGIFILGLGMIITWRRNGSAVNAAKERQAVELGQFKTEVTNELKHINDELKSEDHGLVALAKGQGLFQTHCAKVSTEIRAQVLTNVKDIEELKKESKRR